MVKARQEISHDEKWNVEALFQRLEDWEQAFAKVVESEERPHWPLFLKWKGHLGRGCETLRKTFESYFAIARELERLYTYAHLRHDEEITDEQYKIAYGRIVTLYHDFNLETAWIESEILDLSQETLDEYLESPALEEYRFHLEKIVRRKKHTLSPELEELLALSGKALTVAPKSFRALNDADMRFGMVTDENGEEKELTHAAYQLYLRGHDRALRRNAFERLHNSFEKMENTLCELIAGQVEKHLFTVRARNYSSCLEAALFPKNIDLSVYHSLIEAVRSRIGSLHKYVSLRKRIMNVKRLHLYDMYVPLVAQVDMKMTFTEAQEVVVESVLPLGEEYQNCLRKGLETERWVDRYENANKRSGAYSSGCFDSMPYILMNYKGTLNDVFTLAHEAGHSMHSFLSRQHQPYHYADYPIFVAEVASTFNEELLMQFLLQRVQSKEEKIYLINQKIEDIRATLFRQTMFAEFELLIHQLLEEGTPLTPGLLKEEYRELNEAYFGSDVFIDEEIDIEWARIPHFYYNFYVYQYATGISAALVLADRVVQGGKGGGEDYLAFLKGGCSRYPLDLLRGAGVDMVTPDPVCAAIDKFDGLVKELDVLTETS